MASQDSPLQFQLEIMNELAKFSSEELREELKRRAKEARAKAREKAKAPEYIFVKGVVKKIRRTSSFQFWRFEVEIPKEEQEKYGIKEDIPFAYFMYGGRFKKANCPQVGEEVILRCRLTKKYPTFSHIQAKLYDKVNSEAQTT